MCRAELSERRARSLCGPTVRCLRGGLCSLWSVLSYKLLFPRFAVRASSPRFPLRPRDQILDYFPSRERLHIWEFPATLRSGTSERGRFVSLGPRSSGSPPPFFRGVRAQIRQSSGVDLGQRHAGLGAARQRAPRHPNSSGAPQSARSRAGRGRHTPPRRALDFRGPFHECSRVHRGPTCCYSTRMPFSGPGGGRQGRSGGGWLQTGGKRRGSRRSRWLLVQSP